MFIRSVAGIHEVFRAAPGRAVPHQRQGSGAWRARAVGARLIAPGQSHLLHARNGANYVAHLSDARPVNRHRPSVDVVFPPAPLHTGKNSLEVILTGMGKDGTAGLLEMRNAGAYTFAQDEASCVVFGMPREAIVLGGADEVAPLSGMSRRVMARLAAMGERFQRV